MININTIDMHTIKELIEQDSYVQFVVHGNDDGFNIEIIVEGQSRWLRKVKTNELRLFRNPGSAVLWIKETFAITRVEFDSSNWDGAGIQWRESPKKKKQRELNLTAA